MVTETLGLKLAKIHSLMSTRTNDRLDKSIHWRNPLTWLVSSIPGHGELRKMGITETDVQKRHRQNKGFHLKFQEEGWKVSKNEEHSPNNVNHIKRIISSKNMESIVISKKTIS